MSDLRERVADILYAIDCTDSDIHASENMDPAVLWAIRESALRRADVLIRELGLRQEWRASGNSCAGPQESVEDALLYGETVESRYVTAYKKLRDPDMVAADIEWREKHGE
jgi:hypothetical protein